MSKPFLSIIIPTYNRAHLIENTLLSVLNQSCDDFEVIVIDDGSTDNTEEVITSLNNSKIQYYKVSNGERGKARNEGTKRAKGQYINWFDSDDEMLPNHVAVVIENTKKLYSPEVISFNYKMKDLVTKMLSENCISSNNSNSIDPLIKGNYISCNALITRKDIALAYPFDETRELSASEDYELWLRLRSSFKIHQLLEVTSYVITHPERSVNTMSDAAKLEERFLLFIKKSISNKQVLSFLGKNKSYFVMRNLLFLSVELAFHKHTKKGFYYLLKAFKTNPKAVFQRTFWGTVKHLVK